MKSNTNVQEKAELKKAVSLYCVQRGISKADFAVKVGVSSATLSNIENERWEKVSEAMCKKIWSQLKKESTGNLYNTIDFESVCKLCESAQKHHLMIPEQGKRHRLPPIPKTEMFTALLLKKA